MDSNGVLLALDIGGQRIGVALADGSVHLAFPLTTIANNEDTIDKLQELCTAHHVTRVIVGLPRGMQGQETDQTRYIRDYATRLEAAIEAELYYIDEAATSIQAEAELKRRGKPYVKADIDALAATYILQDYLDEPGQAMRVGEI